MRKLLVAIGILAVVMGSAGPEARGAAKKVNLQEQQLYEMYFSFCNAWNKKQSGELAAFYTDDADHFAADGSVAKGRGEIQELFADQLNGVYDGTKLKLTLDSLRFLSPEIALANGSFELTGMKLPTGQDLPPITGLHTDVWTIDDDGQWRVTASRTSLPAQIGPPAARTTQAPAAPSE